MYFNPDVNQDALHELATVFQEHIHDEWNNEEHPMAFDVKDVTFEMVMEIAKLDGKDAK